MTRRWRKHLCNKRSAGIGGKISRIGIIRLKTAFNTLKWRHVASSSRGVKTSAKAAASRNQQT